MSEPPESDTGRHSPSSNHSAVDVPDLFRPDAKVWDLYLSLAEAEAKERAAPWNTALDSLLIFAGLFAGVVSTFLVDARGDLQADSMQRSLTGLLNLAQSRSIADFFTIPVTAQCVCGLWVISLGVTLFSAVMAVISKGQLAEYVVASAHRSDEDAYRRHRLDEAALRWYPHVTRILSLLVQAASLLFVIGLIVQLHGDSTTIGRILMSLTIVGIGIYFATSRLPSLASFRAFRGSAANTPQFQTDKEKVLYRILYERLIKSEKAEIVDEAIMEISQPPGVEHWAKMLCGTETPLILLLRMRHYATSQISDSARRQEALSNHLSLFIAFAELYEGNSKITGDLKKAEDDPKIIGDLKTAEDDLKIAEDDLKIAEDDLKIAEDLKKAQGSAKEAQGSAKEAQGSAKEAQGSAKEAQDNVKKARDNVKKARDNLEKVQDVPFHKAMHRLSTYGYPAHRLDILPKGCWPLALRLRGHLLIISSRMRYPPPLAPKDLDHDEFQNRPWEMIPFNVHSRGRIHISIASCRGLTQGEKLLKAASASVMGIALGKAAVDDVDSKWEGVPEQDWKKIKASARDYIWELYDAQAQSWEEMAVEAFRKAYPARSSIVGNYDGGIPILLALSISEPDPGLRAHAIKILRHIHSDDEAFFFVVLRVENVVATIIEDGQGARDDGPELLKTLVQYSDSSIPKSIILRITLLGLVAGLQLGLSKSENGAQISTMQLIEKLLPNERDRRCDLPGGDFEQAIVPSIVRDVLPDVLKLSLDNSTPVFVRQTATKLTQRLCQIDSERARGVILGHLKALLESRERTKSRAFLNTLQVLTEAEDFPPDRGCPPYTFSFSSPEDFIEHVVGSMFEEIVEVAIHELDSSVSSAARKFLESLVKDSRFTSHLPRFDAGVWLRNTTMRPFKSNHRDVRRNALRIVELFSDPLTMTVTPALLDSLVELSLTDDNEDIRVASAELLPNLWKALSTTALCDTVQKIKPFIADFHDAIQKEQLQADHATRKGRRAKRTLDARRERWVLFFGKIGEHVPFREAVPVIMHLAVTTPEFMEKAATLLASDCFTKDPSHLKTVKENIKEGLSVNLLVVDNLPWVMLLVKFLAHRALSGIATEALSDGLTSVKETLRTQPKPQVPRADGSEAPESEAFYRYLGGVPQNGRIPWVKTVGCLAEHFPEKLPNASSILLELAMGGHDGGVREVAFQCLGSLVKGGTDILGAPFVEAIIESEDRATHDSDWRVRVAVAQLLAWIGGSKRGKLPERATTRLIAMALGDDDYHVRSQSVNSLATISANTEQYPGLAASVSDKFETGILDDDQETRLAWIRLLAPHRERLSDWFLASGPPGFDAVLDLTICDDILEQLLSDVQDEMPTRVGKLLADAIMRGDRHRDAILLLNRITAWPGPLRGEPTKDAEDKLSSLGHGVWVKVIMLLGRHHFEGVPKIVEMAIREKPDSDDILELKDLFQTAKLLVPIQEVLTTYIEKDLQRGSNAEARHQAVSLLDKLVRPDASEGRNYGGFLDGMNDSLRLQLIPCLADIAVKDEDRDLGKKSLRTLQALFGNPHFRDSVTSSLSGLLESCFKNPEPVNTRTNAIEALYILTEGNSVEERDKFKAIVIPSIFHLLKILLGTERDGVWKQIEDFLLEQLPSFPAESTLNGEVLSKMTEVIPDITVAEGQRIAVQLAETLQLDDKTAASIVDKLVSRLRDVKSSLAPAAGIKVLAKLYSKYHFSNPLERIAPAIPNLVAVALDVSGGHATEVRIAAICVLATVCKTVIEGRNAQSFDIQKMQVIKSSITQFMGLLQNEDTRLSVLDLLSSLSADAEMRRTISLQIVNVAFAADNSALQVYCELLGRLISDERFHDEPSDTVMLILTAPIVAQPKVAPATRFEILTAICCIYGSRPLGVVGQDREDGSSKGSEGLIKWFTSAMFGRHATREEVQMWLERCKLSKSEHPGIVEGAHPTGGPDAQGSAVQEVPRDST